LSYIIVKNSMNLHQIPLFQQLDSARNVLIAGAGGGFDIFCGLPLYFSLKAQGKNVFLANFSFTELSKTSAKEVFAHCRKVTHVDKQLHQETYFPEKYLSEWFHLQNEEVPVYAFERTGVIPLQKAYEYLIEKFDIDTLLLIDGGTDSLMMGDEELLGTPIEDSTSMAAAFGTDIPRKLLVCLGFGVDHFHGVSHYRFLENVAKLIEQDGYYGAFSLLNSMEEYKKYKAALDYANEKMRFRESIVSNSIVSAIDGNYGDFHRTERTFSSILWINPLMSLYWSFDLGKVISNMHYYNDIKFTTSALGVNKAIANYRRNLKQVRTNRQIPI